MANPSSAFIRNLVSNPGDFLHTLTNAGFYVEWLAIGVALTLAWLLALLIRGRALRALEARAGRYFDRELVAKPLTLLAPLIAVLLLGVAKPFAILYGNGAWIDAVIGLTIAYFFARSALLAIRSRGVAWLIAVTVMIAAALSVTGFLAATTGYLDGIAFEAGKFRLSLLGVVQGGVILVLVLWLAGLSSRTLESYLRRSSDLSYTVRELSVKILRILIYCVAGLAVLSAVGIDLTAFAVFGGALGVGIGLGLQKITANFISGITLLMEKSVKIGDLIQIGDETGWVRQLNTRYTLIEAFDGREISIPNEELASSRVVNWTHSNTRARVEVEVGVAYGSDMKLVKKLLLDAATGHPQCLKDPAPGCWMRKFNDSSVDFLLVFWVSDVREGRYGPQSDVMFTIMDTFREHGVEIPFPQRVVTMHGPQPGAKNGA